jgi:hypothetical protein
VVDAIRFVRRMSLSKQVRRDYAIRLGSDADVRTLTIAGVYTGVAYMTHKDVVLRYARLFL